jgi:hypothetical protein
MPLWLVDVQVAAVSLPATRLAASRGNVDGR